MNSPPMRRRLPALLPNAATIQANFAIRQTVGTPKPPTASCGSSACGNRWEGKPVYEVFSFVDEQFKAPLENFISEGTSNVSEWISGPLTAAITLYIVLYGYLVLRGSVQEPILDFAYRAIKLAIIVILVKNASEYQIYVTK